MHASTWHAVGQQGGTASQEPTAGCSSPCPAARTQQRAAELERAARALRRGKLHKRNLAAVLGVAQQADLGHGACGRRAAAMEPVGSCTS